MSVVWAFCNDIGGSHLRSKEVGMLTAIMKYNWLPRIDI